MQRSEYAKERDRGDASKLKVGIVVSRFNEDVTEGMLDGALETLREWKVDPRKVRVVHVAGSFEIPYGCLQLIKRWKPDAVIALGCVIKGETDHDRYIADAVSHGIMRLSLDHSVPISFGVITTNNLKQAKERSRGKTNKGPEAAAAALEAALL
jgi:6,7-dimethyl-8-ribityllumazine synthase